jgi:hypothetical protein
MMSPEFLIAVALAILAPLLDHWFKSFKWVKRSMIAVAVVLFAFAAWKYNSNNSQTHQLIAESRDSSQFPLTTSKSFPKKNTTKRKYQQRQKDLTFPALPDNPPRSGSLSDEWIESLLGGLNKDIFDSKVEFRMTKSNEASNGAFLSEAILSITMKGDPLVVLRGIPNLYVRLLGDGIIAVKAFPSKPEDAFLHSLPDYSIESFPSFLADRNRGLGKDDSPHCNFRHAYGDFVIQILHSKPQSFEFKYKILLY